MQNPRIQLVRTLLSQVSAIRSENAFAAEGVRLVEEGIHEHYPLQFILYSDQISSRGENLVAGLPPSVESYPVTSELFQKISGTDTSQGILAVFSLKTLSLPVQRDFLVIADGIRDPGNLGTLIRTAEATGAQGILLSPGTTQAFAPKVVRSGMGAHFRLPILACSWQEITAHCQGLTIFCAEMSANMSYYNADFRQPLAIVIGSEAQGISAKVHQLATLPVSIPMPGRSESLNAAMAGVILVFEVVRQRNS